jgi:hypothetical protein
MTTFEIGADLRFFMNRFSIDVSYFSNTITDLLLDVPIPVTTGFTDIYTNSARLKSDGIELSISAKLLTGKFGWDVYANWTKMNNMVTELAPGVDYIRLGGFNIPQIRAVAGEKYGTLFGYDWYRDSITGRMLINDNPNDEFLDGFPMTDRRKMVPVGNVNPDWTANIMNTFVWNGFRLSFLLDIKKGGSLYNGTAFAMNFYGVHARTASRDVEFTPEGTIDFEKTPEENIVVFDGVYGRIDEDGRPVSTGITNVSPVVKNQDWYVDHGGSNFAGGAQFAAIENAGWIRLREVTLAYSIPLKKKIVKRSEVYFTGRNLLLFTPYTGIDPETNLEGAINGQGMDYFNMPGTRTYLVGLRMSF